MKQTPNVTRCFSCKGPVPDIDGPTHEYILSAPGCWKRYGEILAKEYMPENYDPDLHRITVDAYAVQHPGNSERRAIQSVNVHLISLHAIFEEKARGNDANALMKQALADDAFIERLQWLEPPSFDGTLTVSDVINASSSNEHADGVRRWGISVWEVWRNKHYDAIARLVGRLRRN